FPTFRHVLSTMAGGHAPKEALIFNGNFWGFFGAQAALLTPLFFALLLWALWYSISSFNKIPRSARLAAVLTVVILGSYQTVSLFMKIQGNWAVFAYPGAIALLGWFLSDVKKSRLLFSLGALVALLESLFILLLPYQQTDPEALVKLPFKLNRFRECMGWDALGPLLTAEGYLPGHDFLIADSYQNASLLSFYAPEQKRAFFFNIRGRRQNQFSYWPQLREENRGKSGYFVTTEELPKSAEELALQKKETLDGLAKHFKLVLFLKSEPFYCTYGEPAKLLMIFRVEDYQGTEPEETFLY
ncbi:MAG: hypothetical protein KDK48_04880, partial [Chlamydiia bacterium]|nr:hypothetical protein [Chlamydiia bacterium]